MSVGTNVGPFEEFGRAFSGTPWRPYYVRWERRWRLHFARGWGIRAEIEVQSGSTAFSRLNLEQEKGSRGAWPLAEPGFRDLQEGLQGEGYELREDDRVPIALFLKRFKPTAALLDRVRGEVEQRFLGNEPGRKRPSRRTSGIPEAMRQFGRASGWLPTSCGWSRRLRLRKEVQVILAILLMPRDKGSRMHPEACVLLDAPEGTQREVLTRFAPVIQSAGYRGTVDLARPAKGRPFQFGHFWKARLGPAGARGARRRLDELAQDLARIDAEDPGSRMARGRSSKRRRAWRVAGSEL